MSAHNQRGSVMMILVVLVLIAVAAGSAYYLGRASNQTAGNVGQQQQENAPKVDVPKVVSLPTTTPTQKPEQLIEYTSTQLPENSMKPYKIKFSSSWNKEVKRETSIDILTLSKNKYSIQIWQGPTGGGGCVFDGDLSEGPNTDYRSTPYTEVRSDIGILRRVPQRSDEANTTAFTFCLSNDGKSFGAPTLYGGIAYKVPESYDPAMLKEMDKIVASLEPANR